MLFLSAKLKHIQFSHLWWGNPSATLFCNYKRDLIINYRVRKNWCYSMWERRSSLRQWLRQYLWILWVSSNFKVLDDKTTSMVQNFWQGQKNEKIKTKWLRWNNVCTPEEESDLCICNFEVFNLALLAKRERLISYA